MRVAVVKAPIPELPSLTEETHAENFPCATCGKFFSSKDSVVKHLRTHTGILRDGGRRGRYKGTIVVPGCKGISAGVRGYFFKGMIRCIRVLVLWYEGISAMVRRC